MGGKRSRLYGSIASPLRLSRITGLSPLKSLVLVDTSPNSHPVAAHGSRTTILHSSGESSDERDHSSDRLSKPNSSAVRSPASAGTDQVPEDSGKSPRFSQGCLWIAPSMTTPAVA